jgi:hypothetical protein
MEVDVEWRGPWEVTRIESVFDVGETIHTFFNLLLFSLIVSVLILLLALNLLFLRLIRSSLAKAGRSAGGVYI